jgi:tight adherence protein B
VALAGTLLVAALPLLWLAWRRARRLAALRAQLPDAVDLMARSLRAGHALPAALQMVGEESPEPLAEEFRITHDELNFGLGLDEALRNLATRVPGDDMRFLIIAVLLQRETGGNLAQLLTNIAQLVRARMRLLGKVRVLAAEGKFSAWILALMPLVVGAMLTGINPTFMAALWRDPIGVKLIQMCLVLYTVGVLWITRLVRLRV